MLRTRFASGSRLAAFAPSPSAGCSLFHTSSSRLAQVKRTSARIKKENITKTAERLKMAEEDRPSVVLGTRPREEAEKWGTCKLAKVLVTEEQLALSTETQPRQFSIGQVDLPKEFGFGVTEKEAEALFEELPMASQRMTTTLSTYATGSDIEGVNTASAGHSKRSDEHAAQTERLKANLFAKAVDLRNANAAGIAFENRRRIIQAFSTPENPVDSGRTEVQVALLTYKIRNLWKHLTTFKRDVGNRRNLRDLIHQRAKHLRYLKKNYRARYDAILEDLALDPSSVEGELVV